MSLSRIHDPIYFLGPNGRAGSLEELGTTLAAARDLVFMGAVLRCSGCSQLRTRTALGSYRRAIPRSIEAP